MESFISNSLEKIVEDILRDGKVSFCEYQKIRDLADEKMDSITKEFGNNNELTAFQKSVDVSMQLLQNSVLKVMKDKSLTPLAKAQVRDALKAQVEYLELGTQLFLDHLSKIK